MKILLSAALLSLAAPAVAQPAPPASASFRDWSVVCDNVDQCTAIGYAPGLDIAEVSPFLWLKRDDGPDARPDILIGLGWTEEAEAIAAGAAAQLRVAGARGAQAFTGKVDEDDMGVRIVRLAPADEKRFLAALKDGDRIAITAGGKALGQVSLAGSSAALRWMDDRQGRVGTVTALVATGPKPASAVATTAWPTVRLVNPVGPEAETALPPALLARKQVQTCIEDQGDPDGEFARPKAMRMAGKEYLWTIPCGRGAYNFTSYFVIAGKDGSGARSPGLGEDDMVINADIGDDGILGVFAKGRGIGDCGQAERWAWDGRRFRLVERFEMNDCRGLPPSLWPRTWVAKLE